MFKIFLTKILICVFVSQVRDLCFDSSGTYLAVAGSDVRVYLCKQWNELKVTFMMAVTALPIKIQPDNTKVS